MACQLSIIRPTSKRMYAELRRNAGERHLDPASGRGLCAYRARSASFQRHALRHQAQARLPTSAIIAISRIPAAFRQLSADNGKPPRRPSGIPCRHYDQRPHTHHRPRGHETCGVPPSPRTLRSARHRARKGARQGRDEALGRVRPAASRSPPATRHPRRRPCGQQVERGLSLARFVVRASRGRAPADLRERRRGRAKDPRHADGQGRDPARARDAH